MVAKSSLWDRVKYLANGIEQKEDRFFPLGSIDVSGLVGFDGSMGEIHTQQFLIDEGYGSNSSAYAIIKTIAQTGASLPLKLYSKDRTGEKVEITKGELFDVLKHPAMMQGQSLTCHDWLEMALTYLLATGNLYQVGVVATGFGDKWQQLQFLPSGKTLPMIPQSFLEAPIGYEFNDLTQTKYFEFDQVMHTRFISPTTHGLNNFIGLSPLQAAIYSLTGSTDIQKAIAIMVKNQGVRGVLTNESDRSMTTEERNEAQRIAGEKLRGIEKFNKIMVANTKMNYLQVGMSATDLKIIESGVLTDRQLSNAYSFPSVLLNDPANTSYNNQATAVKALYNKATIPVVEKILSDCNNIWLTQWGKADNKAYSWEVCKDEIEALQEDQILIAQKDKVNSDAIIAVLAAPISQESKIQILMFTHSIPEDQAKDIVGIALPSPITTTV